MRQLSVYVTGIAAFVEDFRRAVAVNAFLPTVVEIAGRPITVPAHLPYVRLPIEHIPDPERYAVKHNWDTAVAPAVFPREVERTVIKFLRFQEVELPASDSPAIVEDLPLNDSRLPIVEQEDDNGPRPDHASVRWLADMRMLTPVAEIDAQHVVRNPGEAVAAYIRFPNGHISTAFATPFRLQSINAATGQPQGELDQAVAQLMVCRMSVPDEEFTVLCRDYRNDGANNFTINFKAGVPDPWMVFACTSLEDALQVPMDDDPFGVDAHFSLVYRLTAGASAENLVLPTSGEGPKPLGTGRCMPPRMTGGATGGL